MIPQGLPMMGGETKVGTVIVISIPDPWKLYLRKTPIHEGDEKYHTQK